jgi:hypothetical protein
MSTATSAVNATLTNLVTAVTASVNDTTVLVCEGPPGEFQPDDMIVIGERITQQYEPHALVGSMGSAALHETFQIYVHIDCYRGGDTFATTRARCLTLAKAIDDAVRNDPTVGGAVYLAYPSSHAYEQSWDPDNKGTRVTCELYVHCQALP